MRKFASAAMVVGVLAAGGIGGCQDDSSSGPAGFGMQIRFITDEGVSAEIPASIYDGYLRVCMAPTASSCDDSGVFSAYFEVGNPGSDTGLFAASSDIDGDGRPEKVIEGLPMDQTLKLVVTAHPSIGTPATFSARVDGIRLSRGERRFLSVTLLPVGQFAPLDETVTQAPESFTGRFGATATMLPASDGRILIAGGFDTMFPITLTDCRTAVAPRTLADGTVCFRLIASPKAFVLEPGSGRIHQLAQDLTAADGYGRAFHTATALPDGRVVLAGGMYYAIVLFEPLATGDGYLPDFVPVTVEADHPGFDRSFEIFNPQLNALADNPARDGNPQRGGFEGVGNLAAPRVFATAALWPEDGTAAYPRVVMFGGLDPAGVAPRPSISWEAWNADGSGSSVMGTGTFPKARTMSGLAYMLYGPTHELWMIGGAVGAATDADLITIWQSTAGGGALAGGSPLPPTGTAHADKNFFLPCVTPLGNVDAPVAQLVTGSLGPICSDSGAGTYTPTYYDATATDQVPCPPNRIPPYVVNKAVTGAPLTAVGGWTTGTDNPHVLGACATLGDGSAVVVGGAGGLDFAATRASHRVTWAGTAATKDATMPATAYPTAALLPAAATTVGGDAVFVGGMTVTLTGTPAITFLDDVVVFNHPD